MAKPELGVGLVWQPGLDPLCRPNEGLVDAVEVEPESFWRPTADGAFQSLLPILLAHLPQPILLHGVGAVLGGTAPPRPGHAAAFAGDIARLQPAFVSEHLSITHFRPRVGALPVFAGFMVPPLQTEAGVALAVSNIRARRAALGGAPLAVETPVSYLPPAPGEMPDGDFLAAVARSADCGLLLDLHNVLCNARNGRQPVAELIRALPLERVWELHLAGGESEDGFYLDAHAGVPDPELMELAAEVVPRLPNLAAIVFEIMPERVEATGLGAIAQHLSALRELWAHRGEGAAAETTGPPAPAAPPSIDPASWETLLGLALTGLGEAAPPAALADWWGACAPAIALYRKLAGEARASAAAIGAPSATRTLLRTRGGGATRRLLADFWTTTPPGYMAIDEARAFLRYLRALGDQDVELARAVAADARVLAEL
jgi:uncharacterized protein (UPF0276 family)